MSTDLYLQTSAPYGPTDIVLDTSAVAGAAADDEAASGGDWRRFRNPLPPERPAPKVKKKKRRLLEHVTVSEANPIVVHAATVEEAFALLALASS